MVLGCVTRWNSRRAKPRRVHARPAGLARMGTAPSEPVSAHEEVRARTPTDLRQAPHDVASLSSVASEKAATTSLPFSAGTKLRLSARPRTRASPLPSSAWSSARRSVAGEGPRPRALATSVVRSRTAPAAQGRGLRQGRPVRDLRTGQRRCAVKDREGRLPLPEGPAAPLGHRPRDGGAVHQSVAHGLRRCG